MSKDGKYIGEEVLPIQNGVGIPGGCEIVIQTCYYIISDNTGKDNVVLQLDFKNAFNFIDRKAIRRGIVAYAPQLCEGLW